MTDQQQQKDIQGQVLGHLARLYEERLLLLADMDAHPERYSIPNAVFNEWMELVESDRTHQALFKAARWGRDVWSKTLPQESSVDD